MGLMGLVGPQGPIGPTGPQGEPGEDVDPALLESLLQQLECHRVVTTLTTGGALKLKWRRQETIVRLDVRRATHLGIDLATAIGCSEIVFPDYEVVLVDGGKSRSSASKSGSSKGGSSKSQSRARGRGRHR